jgi:hypothetical protein
MPSSRSSLLHKCLSKYASEGVGEDELATLRKEQKKQLLAAYLKKMQNEPTEKVLNKVLIPVADLSVDDLKQLGFKSSLTAVPEIGQTDITTYMQPESDLHLHRHADNWQAHVNDWPSVFEFVKKRKAAGSPTPWLDAIDKRRSLFSATLHMMTEKAPEGLGKVLNKVLHKDPA